jgi:modulator of FtsH protease HflC
MSRTTLRFVLLALAALWATTCPFTVEEGQVGIVTRFGRALPTLAEPGLHWKAPWPVDAVVRLDRRLLVFDNEPTEMLTRDRKNVLVDSFLCWRIADPLRFAQTVRTEAEAEARLLDLSTAALGAALGTEPMEHLINPDPTKVRIREIARRVTAEVALVARASFGIEIVELGLNGFNLPPQNRASVIERMRAERARIATAYRSEGEEEALKIEASATAEREQILAEARAEAEATRGEGEAAALALFADAYARDPEFYRFLRSLEASEAILDENTTIFLPADSKLLEALGER